MLKSAHNKKHMIWQNYNVDVKDFDDYLAEECPNETDEDVKQRLCEELNNSYLEDEQMNLRFIQAPGQIIQIAQLGLWNGNPVGYKLLNDRTVGNLLRLGESCDYGEFYIDNYWNLRSNQTHHDGTNHYLYRAFKPKVTDAQFRSLTTKLYNGIVDNALITRLTVSLGKDIGRVYGWCD